MRIAEDSVDVVAVDVCDIPDSIRGVLLLRSTFGVLSIDVDAGRTGNETDSGRFFFCSNEVSDRMLFAEKLSDCARRPESVRGDGADRSDIVRGVGVRFATFLIPLVLDGKSGSVSRLGTCRERRKVGFSCFELGRSGGRGI